MKSFVAIFSSNEKGEGGIWSIFPFSCFFGFFQICFILCSTLGSEQEDWSKRAEHGQCWRSLCRAHRWVRYFYFDPDLYFRWQFPRKLTILSETIFVFANRSPLIRGDGVCLPDECSWVHLQGRQFRKKGSAEVKSLLQKNSLLNKLTCNQDPLTFEVLQLKRYFQSG